MNDEVISQPAVLPPADTAVTKPDGDLVAAHLPAFRSRLTGMVAAGIRHLTIDLGGVTAIDSMGIGLLVSVHNSLRKIGGELKLIHVSKDILALLQAMRINQHFSVSGN
jgi:anti-anti-sigma factor